MSHRFKWFRPLAARLVESPYLELYARREREGWLSWGDQLSFRGPAQRGGRDEAGTSTATVPEAADDGLGIPAFLDRRRGA